MEVLLVEQDQIVSLLHVLEKTKQTVLALNDTDKTAKHVIQNVIIVRPSV